MQFKWTTFGATYDCNTYGSGSYNQTQNCTTQTPTDNSAGGGLAATGENVVYGLVGGVLLIVIGIVLFIRLHRKKK